MTKIIHLAFEIFSILIPMLILLGFLEVWLPRSAVEKHLGENSGFGGMLIATLLGSTAAGPLVTAFPIAASFQKKKGRTANVVIFLGSWATLKIPMLMLESHYLGFKFSVLRLMITFPFIIFIGISIEKLFRARSLIVKDKTI